MNSNTTPTSGNHAQRSSINKNHDDDGSMLSQLQHHSHHGFPVKLRRDGDGSMISQLQHHVPDDVPVKMRALHDHTTNSRVAGDDFGGLRPKDHS
ncbi:hypothetical protein BG006_009792, partial [Podila minutissima]